jgi:hypothetical protein
MAKLEKDDEEKKFASLMPDMEIFGLEEALNLFCFQKI